jgi:DMSO/TMAO reductase YedYZ molybdopterin-dependent catalytic subunit
LFWPFSGIPKNKSKQISVDIHYSWIFSGRRNYRALVRPHKNKENVMKSYLRLVLSGALLIAMAAAFAGCSGQPATAALPVPSPTNAVIQDRPVPTASSQPVLEITGPEKSISLTMQELEALPVTEGYAGIKSSTGKITPPVPFKGVALKDLTALMGGMDETTGFNVVAEDGYSITFSYDQIQNGSFVAYDPATGAELKNPVPLTAILAYEMDGKPLDPKEDGTLRLAIISPELNQVTDGHWSVKWVNTLEAKSLGEDWTLHAVGGIDKTIDRASIESCGAPQCHGTTWTDDKAQQWVGVPLWLLVGSADDEIEHEGPAFNDKLADAGYTVDVVVGDGYTVTFDAARLNRNNNIIAAYKVNENPLPEEYYPLRLVGSDLQKNEMVGMIKELKVNGVPAVSVETAPTEPASTEAAAATVSDADATLGITGSVNEEQFLNEAALRAMQVVKVIAPNAKGVSSNFEGVRLNALLDLAGILDSATTIHFTASDGYSVDVPVTDLRACTDCLLGFTNTPEKFKLVMPGMTSEFWVKDVNSIKVR